MLSITQTFLLPLIVIAMVNLTNVTVQRFLNQCSSRTQSFCLLQRTTRGEENEESFFHNFSYTQALKHWHETVPLSRTTSVSHLRALLRISKLFLTRQELQRRAAAERISLEQLVECFHSHSELYTCIYSQCSANFEDHRNATDQSTVKVSDISRENCIEA